MSVIPGDKGIVLEIASTRPLTPKLEVVQDPLRLVIDLPGSVLATARRKIPFRNAQIKNIRINQYQSDPAITRVVMDLASPVLYTWDALGDKLNIRVHADEAAAAKPDSVPAFTAGVQPAAVPVAVGSSGTLVEAGSRVSSGSSITAAEETAILRLNRGGEVRVCPGTTISVSTSSNGQDLMLGMGRGAMETHYGLQESVDAIMTPDFRIVLPGPGEFNVAVRADSRGNTCVSSMMGSNASAVVAELLGSGTFEVKPGQQVLFRQGRLNSVDVPADACGCPPPAEPVLRTDVTPSAAPKETQEKVQLATAMGSNISASADPGSTPANGIQVDGVSGKQAPIKVAVEAPLVFSGRDLAKARAASAQLSVNEVAALPLTLRQPDPLPAVVVLPPPPDPKQEKKGFFGKMRGFFGAIFR